MAWSEGRALLRFAWRAAAGRRPALAAAFGLALADLAALLSLPVLGAALVDDLAGGRDVPFRRHLALLVGTGVLQTLLGWGAARLALGIQEGTGHGLRCRVAAAVTARPLAFLERRPLGDLMSRLLHDTAAFKTVPGGVLLQPAVDLVTLAATGCLLVQRHPVLALATLAAAPLPLAPPWLARRRLEHLAAGVRVRLARVTGSAHGWLARPLGLKAQRLEAIAAARIAAASRSLSRAGRRLGRWQVGVETAGGLVAQAPGAVLFAYGGGLVLSGRLSLGDLFAFAGLAAMFQAPLQRLIGLQAVLPTLQPLRRRLSVLLAAPPAAPPASQEAPVALSAEGLRLGHRRGGSWRAEVPRLRAAPGRPVVLAGPPGSGKSTLARHLAGLEAPRSGQVLAVRGDGSRTPATATRDALDLMTQEPALHPGTLLENLTGFDPRPDPGRARQALAAVGLDAWRRGLAAGWNTPLGPDGGLVPSLGQARLLDLARLLYRDAPVWILDEPDQHLDPAGRRRLAAVLRRAAPRTALVVVSHRPAGLLPDAVIHRFIPGPGGTFHLRSGPSTAPDRHRAGAVKEKT